VINLVDEAYGRGFVRVRIRQFHPNLPDTTLIDTYQIEQKKIHQLEKPTKESL
jgi:hypothetical protein